MLSHQRLFKILALLITISFLLVACERPSPLPSGQEAGNDANSSNIEEAGIVATDPNVGGGNDGAEPSGEVAVQPATDETAVTNAEPEPETTETDDAASEETAVAEETDTANTESEVTETQETEEVEETQSEEPTQQPSTHTVIAGDNLFRIGLNYDVSWVTLAHHNKLPNPHRLKIGQVLNIPGSGTLPEEPTPSPSTETTYIVKPGDNLFRIGLVYHVSWIQIAEANGLVNANQISVGQTIKIPVSAPGPTPQFTHEVKPAETLLKISIQYGVTLSAIASENQITSPYVIYVGQTLRIPSK